MARGTGPAGDGARQAENDASDTGSELTSNAILTWIDQSRVPIGTTSRGKPMQNAYIKSFKPAARRIVK